MRKLLLLLVLAPLAAGAAGGISLNTAKRFEFTDCASGGSSAQTLTEGQYLFRVTDKDVFICFAATCASTGEKFPNGTVMMFSIPRGGQSVSCRSSDSTGDAIFTSAD